MFKRTCNYAIRSRFGNLNLLYASLKCRSKQSYGNQSKFEDFLDQEVIEPDGASNRKGMVTPPLVRSEG